jgi:hypothetical protein
MLLSVKKIIFGMAFMLAASLILAGTLATNEGFPTQKNLAFDPIPVLADKDYDKHAVLIGIVYDNAEFGVINYADQDAGSIYNLLTRRLGYPE